MQAQVPESPAGMDAMSTSQPPPSSPIHHDDLEPIDEPQSICLDDLPAEIIDEIVQHVRWRRRPFVPFCRCKDRWRQQLREPSGDSSALAKEQLDPSWAFSCASKRYREIIQGTKKGQSFDLCFSKCCIKRLLAVPEEIRATATYVQGFPSKFATFIGVDHVSSSSVFLLSDFDLYTVPDKDEHECCAECPNCYYCDPCQESKVRFRRQCPNQLSSVLALLPNTTDIDIQWMSSMGEGAYDLPPTHSGSQLQHLKRLNITVMSDKYTDDYASHQADEAKDIIDHLHMPALASIAVDFKVSQDREGYDFWAISEALCGIESPRLHYVTVRAKMPVWEESLPEAWVSPQSTLLTSRLLASHAHCIIKTQAALEVLVLAIAERTTAESITIELAYDLQEDLADCDELFVETDQGMVMLPLLVPDKTSFTDFILRIHTIRGEKRPGCSINVKLVGDIESGELSGDVKLYDRFELLEASYDAPVSNIGNITLDTLLSTDRDTSGADQDASIYAMIMTRIGFHLNAAVHSPIKEELSHLKDRVDYEEEERRHMARARFLKRLHR